jgi:hypothetical protein
MTLKRIAVAGISTLLVAAIAYGGWWAWDAGIVGSNPRAPVEAAMQNAVAMQMEEPRQELAPPLHRRQPAASAPKSPVPTSKKPMPGQFFAGRTRWSNANAPLATSFAQLDYCGHRVFSQQATTTVRVRATNDVGGTPFFTPAFRTSCAFGTAYCEIERGRRRSRRRVSMSTT